jgi:hypothetical protein
MPRCISCHMREGAYQLTDDPISRVIKHTSRKVHQGCFQTIHVLKSRVPNKQHTSTEQTWHGRIADVEEVSKHAHHSHRQNSPFNDTVPCAAHM